MRWEIGSRTEEQEIGKKDGENQREKKEKKCKKKIYNILQQHFINLEKKQNFTTNIEVIAEGDLQIYVSSEQRQYLDGHVNKMANSKGSERATVTGRIILLHRDSNPNPFCWSTKRVAAKQFRRSLWAEKQSRNGEGKCFENKSISLNRIRETLN